MLGNYTPADNAALNGADLDLGSTSPAFIAPGVLAQGGKDGLIRLLSVSAISGSTAHTGSELQNVPTPSKSVLLTAIAVWPYLQQTWLFAADSGATAAWTYSNGALTAVWNHATGGTSPVIAFGLLYVYNPGGGLGIYNPTSGAQIANLTCGSGHWNSPIVADGRIALPEGNANQHAATGVLDIWSRTWPAIRKSQGRAITLELVPLVLRNPLLISLLQLMAGPINPNCGIEYQYC